MVTHAAGWGHPWTKRKHRLYWIFTVIKILPLCLLQHCSENSTLSYGGVAGQFTTKGLLTGTLAYTLEWQTLTVVCTTGHNEVGQARSALLNISDPGGSVSRKPPHCCRTADRSVPARFTQSCLSDRVVPFKSQARNSRPATVKVTGTWAVAVAVKFAKYSSQFEDDRTI